MSKVLELEKVSRVFSSGVFRTHTIRAVDEVSFALERGKTFGLVGNSGCGKTTLSRMITQVLKPTSGRICFEGEDVAAFDRRQRKTYHRRVQVIFQNPEGSLDPSMRIQDSLLEVKGGGAGSGKAVPSGQPPRQRLLRNTQTGRPRRCRGFLVSRGGFSCTMC